MLTRMEQALLSALQRQVNQKCSGMRVVDYDRTRDRVQLEHDGMTGWVERKLIVLPAGSRLRESRPIPLQE